MQQAQHTYTETGAVPYWSHPSGDIASLFNGLDPGFRAHPVCAGLRNRGVRDVLIVCCDGLTGFPEAVEATWPQTTVQTCTVHLIRAAMRFVSYADRKKVAAALKPIYTAPTVDVAESELHGCDVVNPGCRSPGCRARAGGSTACTCVPSRTSTAPFVPAATPSSGS